jgi:hypothetical protein
VSLAWDIEVGPVATSLVQAELMRKRAELADLQPQDSDALTAQITAVGSLVQSGHLAGPRATYTVALKPNSITIGWRKA